MLLDRHSEIAIPLESLFIIDYLRASSRHEISTLLPLLVKEPEIQEWGIRPSLSDVNGCTTIAEAIQRVHEIYLDSRAKRRWGQKTPRFVRHMDLLSKHFAGTRFIHTVRDPRAVVSSLIQSDVHRSNAFHASLRWHMDVEQGLAYERENPAKTLRVHYEDLVTDVEGTLQRILDFLRLPYEPLADPGPKDGAREYSPFYENIHSKLDKPLTDDSVAKWRIVLTDKEVEVVEAINGRAMERLGYARIKSNPGVPAGYKWVMRAKRVGGLTLQTGRYLNYRRAYLRYLVWRKWKLGLLWDFLWNINY